jgi:arylsulfatase A-like enzyme/Flp pilus assembly protein TadD
VLSRVARLLRRLGALAVVAGALACGNGQLPETAHPASRPQRAVLVTIDTLRADHVGCYGDARAATPVLDALAARGVRFARAISPAPLTLPSHATILSGRIPPQHGARHNGVFRLSADVPTLAETAKAAGLATAGFVSAYVLDDAFGVGRGFDYYDDRLGLRQTGHAAPVMTERRGDATVDAALAWLATAPPGFFLWVHLYDPHADYRPPEPYASRFADRPYDGEIAFADAQVGRLLAAVDQRFPDGGTLVAITSDHGESLNEHGEVSHSHSLYEATQHVPWILAGPGVAAGRVVERVVGLHDVAPTLADLLGWTPLAGATGQSLASAARGEGEPPERAAWVETLATQLDMGWSPLLGVRTESHKYIRAPRPELYDLAADPGETRNLATEQPKLAVALDARVEELSRGRPVAPNLALGGAERAQLEALGYVAGAGEGAGPLGVVGGPDPKDEMGVMARVHEAVGHMARRENAQALAILRELDHVGFEIEMMRAEAAIGAGDLAYARESLARAMRLSAGLARSSPWIVLASIEELTGNYAEARRLLAEASGREAHEPAEIPTALGRIAEAEGKRDEARRHYERAMGLEITMSEPFWRLAALDLEDGRDAEARALLSRISQAEIRLPPAALRLARAEALAGRTDLARIRLNGALRAYPDSPGLLQLKAELAEKRGDAEEARAARRELERLVAGRTASP